MSRRFNPGAAIGSPAVARTLIAAAVPRLVARRDRGSLALARALRTTALGRVPNEERDWARRIEERRRELLSSGRSSEVSNLEFEGSMEISAATHWVSLPPPWCLFLMRLVRELGPRSSLELGSGLGISGAYQAAALKLHGAGRLVTMDAAAPWAEAAEEGFAELGIDDTVELRLGDIEDTLSAVLDDVAPLDYAFIDAEHTEDATIAYFEALTPRLAAGAVVVVDDVTWPESGRLAWRAIRHRPRVAKAVGLGRVGVVVIAEG